MPNAFNVNKNVMSRSEIRRKFGDGVSVHVRSLKRLQLRFAASATNSHVLKSVFIYLRWLFDRTLRQQYSQFVIQTLHPRNDKGNFPFRIIMSKRDGRECLIKCQSLLSSRTNIFPFRCSGKFASIKLNSLDTKQCFQQAHQLTAATLYALLV